MNGTENLPEIFLETHHLMHEYHMAWYRKNYGGIDPRHGQGRILTALGRVNSVTQKELGFILSMRPQSLGELLQKLEANGYISRRRSPKDKRSLIIELTEKGEQFQQSRPYYEALFSKMSETERKNLRRSLKKISKKLEELTIDLNNINSGENNTNVGENNTNVGENNTNVGENNTNVGENNTNVDENNTNVDENNTNVGENNTNVGENNTNVGENNTNS